MQMIKACNALYAVYVNTVDTGVCGFSMYCMLCMSTLLTLVLWLLYNLAYSKQRPLDPVGLAVQQSEEAALFNFLGLVNNKGDCRQDAQPIPNS